MKKRKKIADNPEIPALRSVGLSKHFNSIKALDGVSFEVPRGSIYGFLGPNGSGKSTFIRIITGLIKPLQGHFELFGKPSSIGPGIRRGMGALVDRADFYLNLSAFNNLKLLGRITGHGDDNHIKDLLNLMGLYARRNDKVKTYSQGMKQRLGLAQALLSDPDILVLDEPTTGLDPLGMVEVRKFILKIAAERKVTVFLSSHMLHEVEEICSHFALIFNGRLITDGPIAKIFETSGEVSVDMEVAQREKAAEVLARSELVLEVQTLPNLLRLRVKLEHIPPLIRYLTREEIDIFSVSQRNRLEEFFIRHTETERTS